MSLSSSKSARQIKSEMDDLYIDYGITAKQYYDRGYHKKNIDDIRTQLDKQIKNKIRLDIMAEETGLSTDELKSRMKKAKKDCGMTRREFYIGKFYLSDDEDLSDAYEEWKEARAESHDKIYDKVDSIAEATGVDKEKIIKDMDKALSDLNISKKQFLRNRYHELSRTEMARDSIRKNNKRKRRGERDDVIVEKTGKTKKDINREIRYLRDTYPDNRVTSLQYFEHGFYNIDVYDESQAAKLMDELARRKEIRQEASRGDLSRWDEYAELMRNVLSEERKQQIAERLEPVVEKEALPDAIIDLQVTKDLIGFTEAEYVSFHLWDKNREEKDEFLSTREKKQILSIINPKDKCYVLDSKYDAYKLLKPFYKREIVYISSKHDYPAFKQFALKHKTFVKKGNFESIGRGIEVITLKDNKKLKNLYLRLAEDSGSNMILEERIVPNEKFKKLNPDSVNTIRINTFRSPDGSVALLFCSIRIGRAGSLVDNSGAGGVFMHVNKETGMIDTDGMDETGIRYDTHPDHGYELKGLQLPEWDKAVKLAKELAAAVPDLSYVGWDLTYNANNEWDVVEGNSTPGLFGPQASVQRGVKKEFMSFAMPVFRKMLPEADIDPDRKEMLSEKWGVPIDNA